MTRWILPACGTALLGLAGCGGREPAPLPVPDEKPLDPYRPLMATRINEVLYRRGKPEVMLAELALIGVRPGMIFGDFKQDSQIDDWFEASPDDSGSRYISLTCGLSPVVDGEGRITALYRSRKWIDGEIYEEMELVPE